MTWTITELAAEAALVLSSANVDQKSGRVTDAPNVRNIRFYTAHGLVDRPLALEGRTALYGRRHLLQLVAIKRLQARGLSLAEVQEQLLGADDAKLAHLSGFDVPARAPRAPGKRKFWSEMPAPVPAKQRARRAEGIELAPGVMLLLDDVDREIWEDDLEVIRVAAAPMLEVLAARGLRQKGRRHGEDRDDE